MNCNKLSKIRRELDSLHSRGGVSASDLERVAKKLGRKIVKRGKEPTWESELIPNAFPLTIPHHSNTDIAKGTKSSILAFLESDYDSLFELYKCK